MEVTVRRSTAVLVVSLSVMSMAALANGTVLSAQQIVDRYLRIDLPDSGRYGETRSERVETLLELTEMPDAATAVIARTLLSTDCRLHRLELVEILGRLPTRGSADILIPLLGDPDAQMRCQAIHSLRHLASRIQRSGVIRVPEGPDFPPKVGGLVPHLIAATADSVERNRRLALYALADTRDPAARAELKKHLEDPRAGIRFTAACLLTEFHDPSGLPELRRVLQRLRAEADARDFRYYGDAQHLVASFQRITGECLGEIPYHPGLSSSHPDGDPQKKRQLERLLEAWDEWWAARDREPEK
jgi:hypothetical protein